MKISSATLEILKNFSNINQSIYIKKGNVISTITVLKNIFAEATIPDEFPSNFGIYDLNSFLSVLSLHKEDVELEFDNHHAIIIGKQGRSKVKYRFCSPDLLILPPNKKIALPSVDISFKMTQEDYEWINKNANILQSPNIGVASINEQLCLTTFDAKDDSVSTESLTICELVHPDNSFNMVFKTEHFNKLMMGSYKVDISRKGIAHFSHQERKVDYFIATESESKYKD